MGDSMSNTEHLIENAIVAMEHNHDYDYWMSMWQTKEQLKLVKSPPEEIWDMAQYCVYTYKNSIEWALMDKVEAAYGYPMPE